MRRTDGVASGMAAREASTSGAAPACGAASGEAIGAGAGGGTGGMCVQGCGSLWMTSFIRSRDCRQHLVCNVGLQGA